MKNPIEHIKAASAVVVASGEVMSAAIELHARPGHVNAFAMKQRLETLAAYAAEALADLETDLAEYRAGRR